MESLRTVLLGYSPLMIFPVFERHHHFSIFHFFCSWNCCTSFFAIRWEYTFRPYFFLLLCFCFDIFYAALIHVWTCLWSVWKWLDFRSTCWLFEWIYRKIESLNSGEKALRICVALTSAAATFICRSKEMFFLSNGRCYKRFFLR